MNPLYLTIQQSTVYQRQKKESGLKRNL
jgi:hypothetical protein